MPEVLTKRRREWAARRKHTGVMRGEPLNYNAAVSDRYAVALERLVSAMADETKTALEKTFRSEAAKAYFGMDASISSQARIMTNELRKRFEKLFVKKSKTIADRMIKEIEKVSKASLHASLLKLSGGLSLKTSIVTPAMREMMKAKTAENVALIRSIAKKYHDDVQTSVMRSITTGNGLQDLVPELEKYRGITLRRARFIAEDQTRKAYNAINQQRMQAIGLKKFEWLHSGGGQHPREEHVAFSNNIYAFEDPPYDAAVGKKVMPGELPNCKCRMCPVIEFDDGEEDDGQKG